MSQVIKTQASAIEDEFCLLWFAYLDTRVLCVGMGVCAGSRFKCHGTDRTLVKDFTVTTLNVRLECRHIRVHNIAMHAAAKRVEKSQVSLAQREPNETESTLTFKQVGEINIYIYTHNCINQLCHSVN